MKKNIFFSIVFLVSLNAFASESSSSSSASTAGALGAMNIPRLALEVITNNDTAQAASDVTASSASSGSSSSSVSATGTPTGTAASTPMATARAYHSHSAGHAAAHTRSFSRDGQLLFNHKESGLKQDDKKQANNKKFNFKQEMEVRLKALLAESSKKDSASKNSKADSTNS